ncbi:hypothetical protein ZOSMA_93G00040 [Zostera marina]|uniref:Uncharacterized protein n=1 Tax=Zostera marina TaxID=29655 RepID=A0A0K9NKP1_ZOSMR|nr:hypothetical protein ZOSMA_93G00040 [Zostera marina]
MPGVAAMAEYTDTLEGGGIEGGNVSASSFLNGSDSDQFPISVPISPNQGRVVYLRTSFKLCVISFTLGVFVGFTLKRRLRRWVNKLLKRLKDD